MSYCFPLPFARSKRRRSGRSNGASERTCLQPRNPPWVRGSGNGRKVGGGSGWVDGNICFVTLTNCVDHILYIYYIYSSNSRIFWYFYYYILYYSIIWYIYNRAFFLLPRSRRHENTRSTDMHMYYFLYI